MTIRVVRDSASARGLYLLHYTNMTLRLDILLLRYKARVPIDLSLTEDIGSIPIWQAWLGHIFLGSRPRATCRVMFWDHGMGSGYVRPVLAAGATLEYTVYLDGPGKPEGFYPLGL